MRATKWTAMLCGSALLALAQAAGADAPLKPQVQNGIEYVTGGVGEEQDRLGAASGYNLQLLFAEKGTGAFVSDVHVTVQDQGGRVLLDTTTNGPSLHARLPAGTYRVTAERGGLRQVHTVRADAGVRRITVTWPTEPGSSATK